MALYGDRNHPHVIEIQTVISNIRGERDDQADKERNDLLKVIRWYSALGIMTFTTILGVFGNAIVIISTVYMRQNGSTNVLLVSRSAADLMLILVVLPLQFVRVADQFAFTSEWICKGSHVLGEMAFVVSIYTVLAIAAERYIAICHPLKAQILLTVKRSIIVCVLLWILSVLLASPTSQIYVNDCSIIFTSLSSIDCQHNN
ncbi:chemerin-like receptor 2 [Tubulanus polymorphus]|uniref:chemerin-like receptor 2 n=1 Tax=Tubulanus polymorphus TaxID=672921 RepID=UPI003DA68C2E